MHSLRPLLCTSIIFPTQRGIMARTSPNCQPQQSASQCKEKPDDADIAPEPPTLMAGAAGAAALLFSRPSRAA